MKPKKMMKATRTLAKAKPMKMAMKGARAAAMMSSMGVAASSRAARAGAKMTVKKTGRTSSMGKRKSVY